MQGDGPFIPGFQIAVAGLGAEMGHVDPGHRIGCANAQDGAGRQGRKPLACAQNGQGAKQPLAIQKFVPIGHAAV